MDRFAGSLHDPPRYLMRVPILDLIIARDSAENTTAALDADLPNREATLAPPTPIDLDVGLLRSLVADPTLYAAVLTERVFPPPLHAAWQRGLGYEALGAQVP